LQNVIFGIIFKQCPSTKSLNYFIIVGKLFLWDCRRNRIHPKIKVYQDKIAKKYETEGKINKKDYFEKEWIFSPGVQFSRLLSRGKEKTQFLVFLPVFIHITLSSFCRYFFQYFGTSFIQL